MSLPSAQTPIWHDGLVRASTRGPSTLLLLVAILLATPMLSGCLQRSTTVGDRYSGSIVVATSADNPRGAPQLDIPESMSRSVALSEYRAGPDGAEQPGGQSSAATPAPGANPSADQATRIGTRASFYDLTAGQFGQLGDIVSSSFGDSSMSMDLSAKRSGDVVRFRGSADLSDLVPNRDFLQLTVTFNGPVTATNGDQTGERTVTWTPEPRKPSDFSADAEYADPATAALSSWSWLLAVLCLIVVGIVARLAYVKRDKSPRPGRPRPDQRRAPAPTATSDTPRENAGTGSSTR